MQNWRKRFYHSENWRKRFLPQPSGELAETLVPQPSGEPAETFLPQPGGELAETFLPQLSGELAGTFLPQPSGELAGTNASASSAVSCALLMENSGSAEQFTCFNHYSFMRFWHTTAHCHIATPLHTVT